MAHNCAIWLKPHRCALTHRWCWLIVWLLLLYITHLQSCCHLWWMGQLARYVERRMKHHLYSLIPIMTFTAWTLPPHPLPPSPISQYNFRISLSLYLTIETIANTLLYTPLHFLASFSSHDMTVCSWSVHMNCICSLHALEKELDSFSSGHYAIKTWPPIFISFSE